MYVCDRVIEVTERDREEDINIGLRGGSAVEKFQKTKTHKD